MDRIRVGSRDNALATAQAQRLVEAISRTDASCQAELVPIASEMDQILEISQEEVCSRGLLVKELDQALLEGRIDLAVHSLKDVPIRLPEGLSIAAYSMRADARDTLVLPLGEERLNSERPMGASNSRRRIQMEAMFPRYESTPVRGNTLNCLQHLDYGEYSAVVLSRETLFRLGMKKRISRVFSEEEIVPAAGQGILVLVGRTGETFDCLSGIDDFISRCCAKAERSFVAAMESDTCAEPIAAFARVQDQEISLIGFYSDGERNCKMQLTGPLKEARQVGEQLAKKMKNWYEQGEE
jgi:hydroxymethylbilane synthase